MIQDIAPHRLWNPYDPAKRCRPQDFVVAADGSSLLVADGGPLRFPRREELALDEEAALTYLFSIDDEAFFLLREPFPAPRSFSYQSLRSLRYAGNGTREMFFAAYTAMHLAIWYRNNHFCGTCGHATVDSAEERALVCPSCGRIIYPQLIPAIIAGVIDGDRILLTKYANRSMPFYALIAGFTEIGETFEQCVEREVYEEVGLHVKNIRYYKSQPWGNVQDILAGFYCDVDGDRAIRRQEDELKEAIWVPRNEVVGQTDDFSLTHEMMMTFRAGKEPR